MLSGEETEVLEVWERKRDALEREAREVPQKEEIFVLILERSKSKPLDYMCREHFGQREQPVQRP